VWVFLPIRIFSVLGTLVKKYTFMFHTEVYFQTVRLTLYFSSEDLTMGRKRHADVLPSADDFTFSFKGLAREQFSCTIAPELKRHVDAICKQQGISRSVLFEALLKFFLFQTKLDERGDLRRKYCNLVKETSQLKQRCGTHYDELLKAYSTFGGRADGSNIEETFTKLYEHYKSTDISRFVPLFEESVILSAKQQEILKRIEKMGEKVEGVEAETPTVK